MKHLLERKIIKHLEMSGYPDLLTEELIAEHPQYVYYGRAYRAVVLFGDNYDVTRHVKGTSWSLSLEGVTHYLSDLSDEPNKIILVEADIMGVNLVRLIKEEYSHLEKESIFSSFSGEDEILMIELISIISEKEINL